MEKPLAGVIVVVPFPFSDLSQSKRRPALVLCNLAGDDMVLCMITSQDVRDEYAIPLMPGDYASGGLPAIGNIRPTRLFTADVAIIERIAGKVTDKMLTETIQRLVTVLHSRR